MRLAALLLVPLAGAAAAYVHRSARLRSLWLVACALAHLGLVGWLWAAPARPAVNGWLALDALGLVVLSVVTILFAAVAVYAVGYLETEEPRGGRAFVSCLLAFLGCTSLVCISHHLALLWVGMETTTLALAPLVYHRHDRRSLEAVWKYLVLSSVGIALALLGTFFLAAAQVSGRPLVLEDLVAGAASLEPELLRAAFVFLLVGFGTKMGLAPLHAWKPDTYGEAPSLVAALMAGGLTSCAFLGLARAAQVMAAAGQAGFAQPLLLAFGIASLVVAAAFVLGQTDLKRLLAYSSVEHMGLLALGLGLGGAGAYGSVLHVLNNGLAKGLMFLTVGNIVLATGTSHAPAIRGLLRRVPASGALLLAGLFAVTGSPPFGPFVSEFTILGAAIGRGHPWIGAGTVALLAVIFVGMARPILDALYGEAPQGKGGPRAGALRLAGPVVLGALVLLLGVYLPVHLRDALASASVALGG
ncbi:MAG TPA: proton-conducting transporter membrane subunit, partial [Gemmatimonadales bacterium]|nr:proton-conducting transporter membrane subunit [Gemmatimonadales bacterium]